MVTCRAWDGVCTDQDDDDDGEITLPEFLHQVQLIQRQRAAVKEGARRQLPYTQQYPSLGVHSSRGRALENKWQVCRALLAWPRQVFAVYSVAVCAVLEVRSRVTELRN
jgi:hypothetical protein